MSRTIPRAYVTAAWNDNPVVAKDDAVKYCTALVKEGYLPLCPILAFDGIFPADVEDAHKRKREICGDARNEEVRDDIAIARKAKVIVTTLNGVIGYV